jgi:hypothetical protein
MHSKALSPFNTIPAVTVPSFFSMDNTNTQTQGCFDAFIRNCIAIVPDR